MAAGKLAQVLHHAAREGRQQVARVPFLIWTFVFFVDFPNSGILACLRCLLSSLSHNGMVNNGMEVLLLINVFLVHICYLSNQQLHDSFIEVIYFRSAPHAKFQK